MKPKIPKTFNTVITKLYPEISEIEINNIDTVKRIFISGGKTNDYVVNIVLIFKERDTTIIKTRNEYEESLNKMFKFTYPTESMFIQFHIEKLKIPSPPSREEMVKILFYGDN